MAFKYGLNIKVKDKVTGFAGLVLGRTEYATGCVQYGVSPTSLDKEGKLQEWEWFDESRLEEVSSDGIAGLKAQGGPTRGNCAPSIN